MTAAHNKEAGEILGRETGIDNVAQKRCFVVVLSCMNINNSRLWNDAAATFPFHEIRSW